MMILLNVLLWSLVVAIAAPTLIFCLECAAACIRPPKTGGDEPGRRRCRVTVLIPAHNESEVLGETLTTLNGALQPGDRIVVVADNCTDDTSEIARRHGADVLERTDACQRGKGFALNFGIERISNAESGVVIILDADCQIVADSIDALALAAAASEAPVQALNLCDASLGAEPLEAVSGLAFRFKNMVRAIGLSRLAGVCHLTGTGMAFSSHLLQDLDFAGDNVAEDMQVGVDWTRRSRPPQLCLAARISSPLPQQRQAFISQRTRWEHGHLATALSQAPRLILKGVLGRQWAMLCLGLDLIVPPLSLLVFMWAVGMSAAGAGAVCGASWAPVATLALAGVTLGGSILWAWFQYCRTVARPQVLLAAPLYVVAKLPIYARFITKRQKAWVRTSR